MKWKTQCFAIHLLIKMITATTMTVRTTPAMTPPMIAGIRSLPAKRERKQKQIRFSIGL